MKSIKIVRLFLTLSLVFICLSGKAVADLTGATATDRFGYTGVTTRHQTLAEAVANINPLNTITIGNRDLSLYHANNFSTFYSDVSIIMGAWFYTTDPSGSPGAGNTRGNTGVGFLQLYESPGDNLGTITRDQVNFTFAGYNGTHYTRFHFFTSGSSATPATSSSRFSPFLPNTNDSGTYIFYTLNLVAYGLEGTETSPGVFESFVHPTDVVGHFNGIFHNTSSDANKRGYYRFHLNLDMINWAWENRNDLTYPPDGFAPSYFASTQAVPEPGLVPCSAICALAILVVRRRRSGIV